MTWQVTARATLERQLRESQLRSEAAGLALSTECKRREAAQQASCEAQAIAAKANSTIKIQTMTLL